jgi:hypothetical protein
MMLAFEMFGFEKRATADQQPAWLKYPAYLLNRERWAIEMLQDRRAIHCFHY